MDYSRLRLLMVQKRISERYIAQQIGMTSGGLNNSLKRETLTVENLEKIAQILGVNPSVFFISEDELVVTESSVKYGKGCKLCAEKDGKIELLLKQLSEKEESIKQLYKELGRQSPGKDSKVA